MLNSQEHPGEGGFHLTTSGPETADATAGKGDKFDHRKHLPYIDGLRALAALYVVLHHAWLTVWPDEVGRLPTGEAARETLWLYFGHYAVTVFLVISGFCLMLPVARRGELRGGWKEFYRRRARRILPPYYFAIGVCILLIAFFIGNKTGTHWDISIPLSLGGVLIHLLLLQNLIPNNQINHVFWSTAVEVQLYLWFPLLIVLWRRWGLIALTLGMNVLGIALYILAARLHSTIVCPQYIAVFTTGMFAAAVCAAEQPGWMRLRDQAPWGWIAGLGAIAAILLCAHFGIARPHTEPMDILFGWVAAAIIIYGYVSPNASWNRLLASKPLVLIGGASYSLYLIHAPLLQIVWQYGLQRQHLPDLQTFRWLGVVGVPIAIAASFLFFRFFEKPFMTTGKASRPAEADAPPVAAK